MSVKRRDLRCITGAKHHFVRNPFHLKNEVYFLLLPIFPCNTTEINILCWLQWQVDMCDYKNFCRVLGVVAFVPSEGGSGKKIGSKNSC